MGDGEPRQEYVYTYEQFAAAHSAQLQASEVPEKYWNAIFYKLSKEVFDAGDYFQIVDDEAKLSVLALSDIDTECGDNVFLIDHAWTFRPQDARRQLENMPGLLERMENMFFREDAGTVPHSGHCRDGEAEESDDDEVVYEEEKKSRVSDSNDLLEVDESIPRQVSVDANLCRAANDDQSVERVLRALYRHAHTYTIRYKKEVDEEGLPVWYVMDEFGTTIAHSDQPNCRIVPLFFAAQGLAYSLLFCTKPVKKDEELVRDYADTILLKQQPQWRKLILQPWIHTDVSHEYLERVPPKLDFFKSGRRGDDMPTEVEQKVALEQSRKNTGKLKIFADSAQMLNNLDRVDFTLVDDMFDADILWMINHFHQYRDLCVKNPKALVNQFPFEGCLTVKDLLSATLMLNANGGQGPEWYQTCYNLNTELPQFVSYFQNRDKKGLDNTWIVKPWNLARGMDMQVSNDLGQIIRLIESGPKIVCKYIDNPVLFRRPDTGNMVKFDLRFIVFVNQLKPLKAFIYNNFWIRFAINQFTLTRLDDAETHFTVFNYGDKSKILQMECSDFVKHFENTNNNVKWQNVQQKINKVLRDLLETVSRNDPPAGVAPNAQSRAMYGVDVMLKWDDKEKTNVGVSVLECNFMPDCERACIYYEDFADTVFETLFMDKVDLEKVTEI